MYTNDKNIDVDPGEEIENLVVPNCRIMSISDAVMIENDLSANTEEKDTEAVKSSQSWSNASINTDSILKDKINSPFKQEINSHTDVPDSTNFQSLINTESVEKWDTLYDFQDHTDINIHSGYKSFIEEMIEKYSDASEEEILSLAFIEWNHLREKDRDTYEEISKQKMNEALIIQNNKEKMNSSKPVIKKSFRASTGKFQATGYIMFSSHIRKEIMTNNPSVKFNDVSRIVGLEWKKMSEKERRSFNQKARDINSKTLLEAQAGVEIQIPDTPQTCKDHGRTKRIKTGYSIFANEMRVILREQYPGHKRSYISLLVRDKWKQLDSNDKLRYVNQAAAVNIEEAQNLKDDEFNETEEDHNGRINLSINQCQKDLNSAQLKEKKIKKEKAPMTCYQLFCSDVYRGIKDENPNLSFAEISRKVSSAWKLLNLYQKKSYQEKALIKNAEMKETQRLHGLEIMKGKESSSTDILDDSQASSCSTPLRASNISLMNSIPSDVIFQEAAYDMDQIPEDSDDFNINDHLNPVIEKYDDCISETDLKVLVRSSTIYKPLTAYQYFFVEMHKKLLDYSSQLSYDEVIYLIDHHWSFLPPSQRIMLEERIDKTKNVLSHFSIPADILTGRIDEIDDEDSISSIVCYAELLEKRCQYLGTEVERDSYDTDIHDNILHKLYADKFENTLSSVTKDEIVSPNDLHANPKMINGTIKAIDYKMMLFELLENNDVYDCLLNLEQVRPLDLSVIDDYIAILLCKDSKPNNDDVTKDLEPHIGAVVSAVELFNETPESPCADDYFNSPECHNHLEIIESSREECVNESSNLSQMISQHDESLDKTSSSFGTNNFSTTCLSPPPETTPVKRIRKTPSKPKTKTIFAYQMFYAEMHPKILSKNSNATSEEISRLIEFEWKRLKKSEKKILKDLAQKNIPPINHVHAKKLLQAESSGTPVKVLKLPTFANMLEKTKYLVDNVKIFRVKLRIVAKAFTKFPYDEHIPWYHEIVEKIIDLDTICEKQRNNDYKSLGQLVNDMNLMFNNTFRYNEPESQIYRDALTLKKFCLVHYEQMKDKSEKNLNACEKVQDILFYLFIGVFNFRNNKGRYVSNSFAKLPPYEIVNGQKVRALSFESIRLGLERGFYPRLDKFQRDMFNIFERALKISNPNEELFEDAFTLHKKFINLRDNLCNHGLLLKSQALNFRIKDLTLLLQQSKKHEIKILPLVHSCGNIHNSLIGSNNVQYQLGEFIYVNPPETNSFFTIIQITTLWVDNMKTKYVYGRKFLRPQEILNIGNSFYSNELYQSNEYITLSLTKVMGKCLVQTFTNFQKYLIRNMNMEDLFVCRVNFFPSNQQFFPLTMDDIENLSRLPSFVSAVSRSKPIHMVLYKCTEELRVRKRQKVLIELENDLKEALKFQLPNMVKEDSEFHHSISYLQYNTHAGIIRLGNFVLIQGGDDEHTSILQINQILITKEGSELISGAKFAWSEKAQQLIMDREPYPNEIYLLSLRETHPMSHIVNRCSVLDVMDYENLRATEISEKDVFICCYLFDESKQTIQPLSNGLPKCTIPLHMPVEEIYFIQRASSPLLTAEDEVNTSQVVKVSPLGAAELESSIIKEDPRPIKSPTNLFKSELESVKQDQKLKSPSKFLFQKRYILQTEAANKNKKAKTMHTTIDDNAVVASSIEIEPVISLNNEKSTSSDVIDSAITETKSDAYVTWEQSLVKWVRRQHHLMDPLASVEFHRRAKRFHVKLDVIEPVMQSILDFKKKHCPEFPTSIVQKRRDRTALIPGVVAEGSLLEIDQPLLKEFAISKSAVIVKKLKLSQREKIKFKVRRPSPGRPPGSGRGRPPGPGRGRPRGSGRGRPPGSGRPIGRPPKNVISSSKISCAQPGLPLSITSSPDSVPETKTKVFKKRGRPKEKPPKTKRIARRRRCAKCQEIFPTMIEFMEHNRRMHVKNKCPICGIIFKRNSYYRSHIIWHARIKKHPSCPKCDRTFNKVSTLQKHLQDIHELEDAEIDVILKAVDYSSSNAVEEAVVLTELKPDPPIIKLVNGLSDDDQTDTSPSSQVGKISDENHHSTSNPNINVFELKSCLPNSDLPSISSIELEPTIDTNNLEEEDTTLPLSEKDKQIEDSSTKEESDKFGHSNSIQKEDLNTLSSSEESSTNFVLVDSDSSKAVDVESLQNKTVNSNEEKSLLTDNLVDPLILDNSSR